MLDGRPDLVGSGVLPQLVKRIRPLIASSTSMAPRATLLMLNGAVQDFTFSARVAGPGTVSTQFFNTPPPNVTSSARLASKIEQMLRLTRSAPYPVRRTIITCGILEAALTSKARLNQRIDTPHLAVSYRALTDEHDVPD